jgi:hypothetical protein
MTYSEIDRLVAGRRLPLSAETDTGEWVIIEGGDDYYQLTTVQNNGWCRINEFYEDGTITETYER